MKELLDKTILGIKINSIGDDIIFKTKEIKKPIRYIAEGDCCSHSRVSNIEPNVSNKLSDLFGHKVLDVIKMPSEDEHRTNHNRILVYGWELVFDNGSMYITYRNSSNGYYGGSLYHTEYGNTDYNGKTIIRNPVTESYINKAV